MRSPLKVSPLGTRVDPQMPKDAGGDLETRGLLDSTLVSSPSTESDRLAVRTRPLGRSGTTTHRPTTSQRFLPDPFAETSGENRLGSGRQAQAAIAHGGQHEYVPHGGDHCRGARS